MTLTFEHILSSKEYKKLIHNEKYLFLEYTPYRFIFYKENTTLKCFSIELFSEVTPFELYNLLFSYSLSDFLAVTNQDNLMELVFEPSDLSYDLGECLDILSIENVNEDAVVDPKSLAFIKANAPFLPTSHWKFSQTNQLFYFVAPKNMCVEFNSNMFNHFGNSHYLINSGNKTTRCYLNPFTLLANYNIDFVHETSNIQIGYDPSQKCTLVYRGNHNELKSVLNIVCSHINAFYSLNNTIVSLHLKSYKFSTFSNEYLKKLNDVYTYETNEFENTSERKLNRTPFKIIPNSIHGQVYPVLIFPNTVTHIQISLEVCFKNLLSKVLHLENITYLLPSILELEPTEFIDNPNPTYNEA